MDDENTDGDDMSPEEAFQKEIITEEDLTAERLAELFRHQRVHSVEEKDGKFQFIFRSGNTITVDPSTEGGIAGGTYNKYAREKKNGANDTEGIHAENILELGDLVRLKDPFEPSGEYIEYTHGVVVEIIGKFGQDLKGTPRRVSLHLYNPRTHEIYIDSSDRHGSPVFVDQHVRNLVLLQKASDSGYNARDVDVTEFLGIEDRW